jgi:hypothetical protein
MEYIESACTKHGIFTADAVDHRHYEEATQAKDDIRDPKPHSPKVRGVQNLRQNY